MRKKRVLILSEGFGAGHTQAAQALAASLTEQCPDVRTRVIELSSFISPVFTQKIVTLYRKTIVSHPLLFGRLYKQQGKKALRPLFQLMLHRIFYTEAAKLIHALRPDLIISTHPFPSIVISRLKRQGLKIPLCTVITDYDAHGFWVTKEAEHFLVSSDEVCEQLIGFNIPQEKIQVTGIPVHPKFWRKNNKESIKVELGLQDMPTLLMMGGGWGIVQNEELLKRVVQWREHIQLIFCTGNNEKLLTKLKNDPEFQHKNVHVLGFVKHIDMLMDAADLLLTKPGGMTCTEALAKRLPMLLYDPIPGQEEINCQHFVHKGYGKKLESLDMLDHSMHALLESYSMEERLIVPIVNKKISTYNPSASTDAIIQLLTRNIYSSAI
ncbi:MGDG synthase family glycosyltransferase [Bacillus horti]|uniref:Processive 1,2-diacylglycerol beta-glucosyltransferase n=1 Tax=Caldalkalibacillus horti TaxID=77523 RepID=A0ABT9VZX4_9BACI|nr:glycosyltransferase [Bacillus horti]MDQ0166551.1 processive 1,2-diacylglycerol beta-glucosyltransferase [Bacillus horti]